MKQLAVLIPVFVVAASCAPVDPEVAACRASLEALNTAGVEEIVFAAESYGHAGYAITVPDCASFAPLSIAEMPEFERRRLNSDVAELFTQSPDMMGFGLFKAKCDCSYDARAETVRASSITHVTRGPTLQGRSTTDVRP
ncbi:hypothetical protein [Brevundimonas sp. GCM10030266]|uniref:hypothetical protein n=1 Tax=Brevundimonas sp. GCM10030266 TaxID=3273386 RepID=UPI003621B2F8